MNDGDNTGAIVAGMVTPFILLVTISAVILVCWRWYAHSHCYFSFEVSPQEVYQVIRLDSSCLFNNL